MIKRLVKLFRKRKPNPLAPYLREFRRREAIAIGRGWTQGVHAARQARTDWMHARLAGKPL